jgi:hypothetical protein
MVTESSFNKSLFGCTGINSKLRLNRRAIHSLLVLEGRWCECVQDIGDSRDGDSSDAVGATILFFCVGIGK